LLPSPDDWSATTFPTLAFGQGMSVSALQVAQVFATIANDGVRITPTVVAGLIGPDGKFVGSAAQQTVRVVSVETARKVRSMMETVVSDEGTAPGAAIPGYRVAGKTGTAQRVDDSCGCYRGVVASFIGIAPADKPRFVVAVALTDPRNGRFGSLLGGPVFKEVMTYVLQRWRVAPSGAKAPALPTTWK
jgi:cell division protein FtsI (penicillin-binding protein 3)